MRTISLRSTKFEINEYHIMEKFISSMEDSEAKEELSYAIIGRGAFRRFKDTLIRYDIRQRWFDFQAAAYRDIAIQWQRYRAIYEVIDNFQLPRLES